MLGVVFIDKHLGPRVFLGPYPANEFRDRNRVVTLLFFAKTGSNTPYIRKYGIEQYLCRRSQEFFEQRVSSGRSCFSRGPQ
ncbi:hypothetical protein YC2023_060605 [Brassica napus]